MFHSKGHCAFPSNMVCAMVPIFFTSSPVDFALNICVSRACLHDVEAYPGLERFLPDRFVRDGKLVLDVRDPLGLPSAMVEGNVSGPILQKARCSFGNIAMSLHVFDITPALEEGRAIVIGPARSLWGLSSLI
ncbi:hypothetical protein C8Q74DRAFT_357005 [Fomes fomentarius]|nr:hypothetical protein C8Q74DRAFT_357005 [Fomes fomentarius]